ncbi:MAG TPA: pitrilysin family protein, partial [Terracidiphilus sp.]|nr:pitrilysin family protein [Terracidiphilus sp.]
MNRTMLKHASRCTFAVATLAAMVSFSALSFSAAAQAPQSQPWTKVPIPALPAFHPHEPVRIELKNGIVLFLQPDHELPFVSGSVTIRGGSRSEPEDKAGLVDLYGMTWRTSGSQKMSGDQMDDFLAQHAAHIETDGDVDSTALAWDSLKADSDTVYNLAMDLLFHPQFNAAKLQLAKQQEATGIVRRNDDEGEIASREADRLVYGVHSPYTRQPELATIASISLADLEQWHDRTLRGRLIVSVSGDFDPAAMEAKLRATFEGLPPVTQPTPRQDAFPGPTPGVYFINKEDVNQSNVEIVGVGTTRNNPDVPALAVMNDILGGGFGSRLIQTVRTKLGLAYAVGGGLGFEY